jgi:acyl dehydratase
VRYAPQAAWGRPAGSARINGVNAAETLVDGPYFEDLRRGQRFTDSPALTLTDGLAAAHQAIVGGRLTLTLDAELSARVLGDGGVLAAPHLVWDVAIGQSTIVTHTVVANLFYRGVVFRRAPVIGDTLRTVTEVVGLRQNSRRPCRAATGLAALRISVTDQRTDPPPPPPPPAPPKPGIVLVVHSLSHIAPQTAHDDP